MNDELPPIDDEVLFRVLDGSGCDPVRFRAMLESLSREELDALGRAYLQWRADLADAISERSEIGGSEDTLTDLADLVLESGRAHTHRIFEDPTLLVVDQREPQLFSTLEELYRRTTGESVFELSAD